MFTNLLKIATSSPRPLLAMWACSAVLMGSQAVGAEIYSWTDASGNTVYSDQKTDPKAQATQPKNNVSFYKAPKVKQSQPEPDAKMMVLTDVSAETEAESEAQSSVNTETMTEQQCQEQYQRSCEKVSNWRDYAVEACGNDSRCSDEDFLERKYRPRSVEELREIAKRAGIRNNLQAKKISDFLTKKYTNYCEQQAQLYCNGRSGSQCNAQLESYCEDPRTLGDMFSRYHNLTAAEKKVIIEKATALAAANANNTLNYQRALLEIIDLLLTKATLGI